MKYSKSLVICLILSALSINMCYTAKGNVIEKVDTAFTKAPTPADEIQPKVSLGKKRTTLFSLYATGTPPSGYRSEYNEANTQPALAIYPLGKPNKKPKGEFKPSVQFGALLQCVGVGLQDITSAQQDAMDPPYNRRTQYQMMVYRGRLLAGGRISPKTSFFVETEVPTPIGYVDANGNKSIQVGMILLDAQVEHIFHNSFSIIAGMQLVGTTRNSLQGAASLMALDFGYLQYAYSLSQNRALQNNFGRDVGLNARGFLDNDRLEYRLGIFRGRADDPYSPPRCLLRVNYNFFDKEKDQYYTGTTLGKGKIFAIGGGFDIQRGYSTLSIDAFADMPISDAASITANLAFSLTDGGTNPNDDFTTLIPRQNIFFSELGFFIKKSNLQPYIGYEVLDVNAEPIQLGYDNNVTTNVLQQGNKLNSGSRFITGLNYYLYGYNLNFKLQYARQMYNRYNLDGGAVEGSGRNEIWFQIQFFLF